MQGSDIAQLQLEYLPRTDKSAAKTDYRYEAGVQSVFYRVIYAEAKTKPGRAAALATGLG